MNYSEFEIEDFAADDHFVSWVLDPRPDTCAYWENFRRHHPHVRYKIEKARELVVALHRAEAPAGMESRTAELWSRIDRQIKGRQSVNSRKWWSAPARIAATVSVAVIIAIAGHRFLGDYKPTETAVAEKDQRYIEEVNTSGKELKIHLADGSTVTLGERSRLRYPASFASLPSREVHLKGEAFFDVARNPQQPFLVRAGEITTRVLGTSFSVKAVDGERDIVVAVKEGKVSVFSSTEPGSRSGEEEVNGVVLTPNQRVVYSRSEDAFSKTLVDVPEVISGPKKKFDFTFENARVSEVFAVLEEAYGVTIVFDAEAMAQCYLTVPLGDEPLYEKLRIICRTIGASYELIDASVVITSTGCDAE